MDSGEDGEESGEENDGLLGGERADLKEMMHAKEQDEEMEDGYSGSKGPGHAKSALWNDWELRLLASLIISIDPYCYNHGRTLWLKQPFHQR